MKCSTPHCRRKAAPKRRICYTCKCRLYRTGNPMRAAFKALRDNAKRRGKEFTLTFNQFRNFCIETNYMAEKGRNKLSYTIDRICNSEGYIDGNIQILTKSENSRKGISRTSILQYDWRTKYATVVQNERGVHNPNNPF